MARYVAFLRGMNLGGRRITAARGGSRRGAWLRGSESEFDLKALATILGPTTIRTKGTIDQIAAKYFA